MFVTAKRLQIPKFSTSGIVASALVLAGIAPGCGSDDAVNSTGPGSGATGGRATGWHSNAGGAGKAGGGGSGNETADGGGAGGQSSGGRGSGGKGAGGAPVDSGAGGSVSPEGGSAGALPDASPPNKCGNGHLDPGEQCDDGNTLDEDNCTSTCLDNKACLGCVANNCPLNPVYQPECSDFPDQVSKDACYKVFACLMRTECWREGTLKCYCGNNTIADCKDGTANGDCKKDIDEAFAAAPVDLVVTDPNAIVTNIGRVAIPAGAALSLAECQWKYCYDPSVTSGNWECDPAHQAGGTGGAGAGGAGTGGAGTGGAGTGGTGTGGTAGTGGVGGSGGGTNGMSSCATATTCGEAGSPYDVHTPPCTPAGADCIACEAINCPHNTASQPYCQDLNASADKSACQAVLDCARATNCIATGNVSCFCGADLSVPTCKANPIGGTGSTPGAHGSCVTQIQAAFPTNSTPAYIVDHIGALKDATTTVVLPGGIALSLAQCDYNNCGDITGTNECVPYCR